MRLMGVLLKNWDIVLFFILAYIALLIFFINRSYLIPFGVFAFIVASIASIIKFKFKL